MRKPLIFRNYFLFGRLGLQDEKTVLVAQEEGHPALPIVLQYFGLFLGILVQPLAVQLRHSGPSGIDFSFLTTGWFIASFILGLIVFPGAYRQQIPSPQPQFVQFCVIFGAGVGWQAIFDTIVVP